MGGRSTGRHKKHTKCFVSARSENRIPSAHPITRAGTHPGNPGQAGTTAQQFLGKSDGQARVLRVLVHMQITASAPCPLRLILINWVWRQVSIMAKREGSGVR